MGLLTIQGMRWVVLGAMLKTLACGSPSEQDCAEAEDDFHAAHGDDATADWGRGDLQFFCNSLCEEGDANPRGTDDCDEVAPYCVTLIECEPACEPDEYGRGCDE